MGMVRPTAAALIVLVRLLTAQQVVAAHDPQLVHDGNAAFAAGRLADAAASYRRAADDPAERAVALFNIGVLRARQGDHTGAADAFAEALQAELPEGQRAWARYNRGVVLSGAGRLPEAVNEFKRALLLLPGNDDIRTNLEIALARAKQQTPNPKPLPPRDDVRRMLDRLPDQSFAFARVRRLTNFVAAEKDW